MDAMSNFEVRRADESDVSRLLVLAEEFMHGTATYEERLSILESALRDPYIGAYNAGLKALLLDRKGLYKSKQCQKITMLTELVNLFTIT
jgi:hypothetical protein